MSREQIIPSQSEYEKLLQEIRELQARIVELTAIRDDLLYHVCPSLRAIFDEKIGSIEREILAAKLYLREKQRILEILQAQLNRQEIVSVKEAEEKAGEEFRQYEEDLHKKAEEAEQFNNRWKETQWQKHEEEAKRDSENSQDDSSDDKNENGTAGDQDDDGSTDGGDHDSDSGSAENGQSESGEKGSYSDSDDEDEDDLGEGAKKPKNPIEALKRLYRKIVKRLHPDVNPNLTEREKELFNEATAAYQAGDLEKMQAIWEELESGTDPEERFEDTPEDLDKLREMLAKLKARVRELSSEISHIRSEYPYTMKEFLEDEEAVEAKRSELQKQLQEIRDADAKLAEFIEQVKKKVKDPWNN